MYINGLRAKNIKKKGGIDMWLLVGAVGFISLVALFFTIKVGKEVETQEDTHDPDTRATRNYPILLNPVFIAYIIGFGGIFILIAYFALR
jgi:predicted MFS family arabinose efflux permease